MPLQSRKVVESHVKLSTNRRQAFKSFKIRGFKNNLCKFRLYNAKQRHQPCTTGIYLCTVLVLCTQYNYSSCRTMMTWNRGSAV